MTSAPHMAAPSEATSNPLTSLLVMMSRKALINQTPRPNEMITKGRVNRTKRGLRKRLEHTQDHDHDEQGGRIVVTDIGRTVCRDEHTQGD